MNAGGGPSRTLAAGLLLLVGVLGLLGGVVLERTVLQRHAVQHDPVAYWGPHRVPDRQVRSRVREHITARMAEELDLSAGQQERLSTVLERQEERLAEAMSEARPHIDQILDETHRQIGEILTPEQSERFEEMWTLHHGPRAR